MKRFNTVELTEREKFKLKVLDAYRKMDNPNVSYLCKLFGIHRATFYRWKRSFNPYDLRTVKYRSRKPKRTRSIDWDVVVEVCEWKRKKRNRNKSHYYLYQLWLKEERTPPCCPKTIYNWWKRRGLIDTRRKVRKRRKSKLFNKAIEPGELVQVDVKYLEGRKRFQYTAIDVFSKWRHIRAFRKFNQNNSITFVNETISKAKEKGIDIVRIQTDNGGEFQSRFTKHLTRLDIKHQYIWVRVSDQNGCVERSHRTDDEEFYNHEDTEGMTLRQLNKAIDEWTDYYNTKRLHFSLNFDTPEEYLEKHRVSHI